MGDLALDFRLAVRQAIKHPGFTLAAVTPGSIRSWCCGRSEQATLHLRYI